MDKFELSRLVYDAMLRKGWMQSDLAREADVPRPLVSDLVRGQRVPSPENLKKICAALGIETPV